MTDTPASSAMPLLNPREKANHIQALRTALRTALALLEALPVRRDCAECAAMQPDGRCDVWGEVVPAEARAHGCERWEEEIPF